MTEAVFNDTKYAIPQTRDEWGVPLRGTIWDSAIIPEECKPYRHGLSRGLYEAWLGHEPTEADWDALTEDEAKRIYEIASRLEYAMRPQFIMTPADTTTPQPMSFAENIAIMAAVAIVVAALGGIAALGWKAAVWMVGLFV